MDVKRIIEAIKAIPRCDVYARHAETVLGNEVWTETDNNIDGEFVRFSDIEKIIKMTENPSSDVDVFLEKFNEKFSKYKWKYKIVENDDSTKSLEIEMKQKGKGYDVYFPWEELKEFSKHFKDNKINVSIYKVSMFSNKKCWKKYSV